MSAYMLRRTQEVLSKHLPPLAVHTMFCKLSALQVKARHTPQLSTSVHAAAEPFARTSPKSPVAVLFSAPSASRCSCGEACAASPTCGFGSLV